MVGRAIIGNRENNNILVDKQEAQEAFKYHRIIIKLPGE
jgi:hypothetical protein